jgi:hypothetical protein
MLSDRPREIGVLFVVFRYHKHDREGHPVYFERSGDGLFWRR